MNELLRMVLGGLDLARELFSANVTNFRYGDICSLDRHPKATDTVA